MHELIDGQVAVSASTSKLLSKILSVAKEKEENSKWLHHQPRLLGKDDSDESGANNDIVTVMISLIFLLYTSCSEHIRGNVFTKLQIILNTVLFYFHKPRVKGWTPPYGPTNQPNIQPDWPTTAPCLFLLDSYHDHALIKVSPKFSWLFPYNKPYCINCHEQRIVACHTATTTKISQRQALSTFLEEACWIWSVVATYTNLYPEEVENDNNSNVRNAGALTSWKKEEDLCRAFGVIYWRGAAQEKSENGKEPTWLFMLVTINFLNAWQFVWRQWHNMFALSDDCGTLIICWVFF